MKSGYMQVEHTVPSGKVYYNMTSRCTAEGGLGSMVYKQ